MDETSHWWVDRDGRAAGPLSAEEIASLPGVTEETWVCPPDAQEWIPAGQVPGIRAVLRQKKAARVAAATLLDAKPVPPAAGSGVPRILVGLGAGFVILSLAGGLFAFGVVLPMGVRVSHLAQEKNDETKLLVLGMERLGDFVKPDGTYGPPESPAPTPIAQVPGLEWTKAEDFHQTPWGEPYLYQCVKGRYRILSPRGEGRYRAFDVGSPAPQIITVESLEAPWP